MDPDVALRNLVDALTEGDTESARQHFSDLEEWLTRGGFTPRSPYSPGAVGTRHNPVQHNRPDRVDASTINARVADDMGDGLPVAGPDGWMAHLQPSECDRCGFSHPPGHGHPVARSLYRP